MAAVMTALNNDKMWRQDAKYDDDDDDDNEIIDLLSYCADVYA